MIFCEALVIDTPNSHTGGAKRGKISAIMLLGHAWGKKETFPRFIKIGITIRDDAERDYLIQNCKYDFTKQQFVYRDTSLEFIPAKSVIRRDYVVDDIAIEEAEKDLNNGNPIVDACGFLQPGYFIGNDEEIAEQITEERIAFLKMLYPYRDLEGVRFTLIAVKYGNFGDVYKQFKALPQQVKDVILTVGVMGEKRYNWFKDEWKLM